MEEIINLCMSESLNAVLVNYEIKVFTYYLQDISMYRYYQLVAWCWDGVGSLTIHIFVILLHTFIDTSFTS